VICFKEIGIKQKLVCLVGYEAVYVAYLCLSKVVSPYFFDARCFVKHYFDCLIESVTYSITRLLIY